MDQFQYMLRLHEIDELRTLKAKDALARELINSLPVYSDFNSLIESSTLTYKCLTKLFTVYDIDRVPAYLAREYYNTESKLLTNLLDNVDEYEILADTFEFTGVLDFEVTNYSELLKAAKLIGSNTVTFTPKMRYTTQGKFTHLYAGVELPTYEADDYVKHNGVLAVLAEVESMRLTLGGESRYELLESLLSDLYSSITSSKQVKGNLAANMLRNTAHLHEVSAIIASRL